MLKLTTLCRNLKSICTATWVIWTDLYKIEIFVTKCTEADDITKDDKSSGWYSAMYI